MHHKTISKKNPFSIPKVQFKDTQCTLKKKAGIIIHIINEEKKYMYDITTQYCRCSESGIKRHPDRHYKATKRHWMFSVNCSVNKRNPPFLLEPQSSAYSQCRGHQSTWFGVIEELLHAFSTVIEMLDILWEQFSISKWR